MRYKELYELTKIRLTQLENNSIDLRTTKKVVFRKGIWVFSVDDKYIILEKVGVEHE